MPTIIDAHAHLVAPETLYAYRSMLLATGGSHAGASLDVSDAALAESAGRNVAVMDRVGTDMQLISPRPFQQGHSMRPPPVVDVWIAANNDLIARTVALHPERFAGVAGLPLAAGEPVERALPELRRCIEQLGFVGCSLNPDPTEGTGTPPTLGDRYWYPLYEALVELDVPALVHSAACANGRETYSEHFITEESIAVLSILRSPVFEDFPELKLIVGHGGGSVPYQVGRWRAARLHPTIGPGPGAEPFDVGLRRFWFDTVLYDQASLELLFRVVGPDRCIFGTEKPGSGSTVDPATGRDFDDLRPVIEAVDFLGPDDRDAIFHRNALAVFSRLKRSEPTAAGSSALASDVRPDTASQGRRGKPGRPMETATQEGTSSLAAAPDSMEEDAASGGVRGPVARLRRGRSADVAGQGTGR